MLFIQVSLNIFLLFGLVMLPAVLTIVFIRRGYQISGLQQRLGKLEKELLINYAEILDLQREKAQLEQKIQQSSIPVIPISTAKEDKIQEAMPDVSARKKMLGQQVIHQNS